MNDPHRSAQQHCEAAMSLQRQGRLAEAEQHYRAALQLVPAHRGALHNLAIILIHTGRLEEAADVLRKVLAVADDDALAHAHLGQVLRSLGRNADARAHLERSLALRPDSAETHANLGNVLAALDRPEDALASYERALALNPRLAEPHNNAGNVLASLGRHKEAVVRFEKALALRPDFASAMNNLGTSLAQLNRHEEAVVQFRRALAVQPDYPAALANLGNSLDVLVRPAESLEAFERLIRLEPGNAWAHFGAGDAHRILGRTDEARRCYERAAALAPGVPGFLRALAETKRFSEGDPQLTIMEELAGRIGTLAVNEQIELHFALAKAYDDIARHAAAFAHWQSGNALKRNTITGDEAAQLRGLRDIETTFTPELIAAKHGLGDPASLPVFIVGMPRSGTTLVEQMLASHPRVFGAGELPYLPELIEAGQAGPGFPASFASLTGEQLRALGSAYVARLRTHAAQAERITDKLPANFRFAGLIHLALPKARLIHVRRDPADTCFSCYTTLFSQGLEFSYELAELGRHYRAYGALMAHWRRALPPGAMLEVQYEDLVADFEPQARRIVEYCGLEWDERCLKFHETRRAVRTASAGQVRRPLFASSIGRWRPYAPWLRPLLDALEQDAP